MSVGPAPHRSKFAGGDQSYLRDVQYANGENLNARWRLHQKYRSHPVRWMTWVRDRVELRQGHTVFEAGCGPGHLWSADAGRIPTGVALTLSDLSPGMVAEAVATVTAASPDTVVSGREADLQDLPFDDVSFDRVVALHMLYHLPDPRRGVAELARVVRNEGRVVVATNGRRHLRALWDLYHDVWDTSPFDDAADVFGIDNGFAILRGQFSSVTWVAYDDSLVCTDPEDVERYLLSELPEGATAAQRAELRAAVLRRFDEGGGRFVVEKETGCFVCEGPRR